MEESCFGTGGPAELCAAAFLSLQSIWRAAEEVGMERERSVPVVGSQDFPWIQSVQRSTHAELSLSPDRSSER